MGPKPQKQSPENFVKDIRPESSPPALFFRTKDTYCSRYPWGDVGSRDLPQAWNSSIHVLQME